LEVFKNRFIEAIKENADFLVYPEYCLTGFTEWDFSRAKLYNLIVNRVSRLANRYGVYVVFGLLEPCNESAYNIAFVIDKNGRIILKHRKIQEPIKFCQGSSFNVAVTEFGRIGVIICGDLYNDLVKEMILRNKPDYLFVPMDYSPEQLDLKEEIRIMSSRIAELGVKTFIVNTYKHHGSFGGAWVFDERGKLIAFSKEDQLLIMDVS